MANQSDKEGRRVNVVRKASMRLWYGVAVSDGRMLERGDFVELYDNQNEGLLPPITYEDLLSLVMRWAASGCEAEKFSPTEQRYIDWFEEQSIARRPLSTAPRSDNMLIYEVTAGLFNNQLLEDQSRGERLSEEPATPTAVQKEITSE